jgi:hypothetical protein
MEIGRKGKKTGIVGTMQHSNWRQTTAPVQSSHDRLADTHSQPITAHSHLTFLNPIVEHYFGRQCQTAMTFCISGLKVSVADIRLSLLNANEGAAQHKEGA